jgi:hypothetical protein
MNSSEQVHRTRALVALVLLSAFSVFFVPDSAHANGVRSLNFNEFSYRVGLPYYKEFGPTVRVHQGKPATTTIRTFW